MRLLAETTPHAALSSGRSPWRRLSADLRGGEAAESFRCEALVVGAGVTGALAAQRLAASGREVVLIDREPPGLGSTSASTAMLQWEIDAPLAELTETIGFEAAATIYRESLLAVAGLSRLIGAMRLSCAFRPRPTLYLAALEVGLAELAREHALRRRAGLPGELLDAAALRGRFGVEAPGAILSPGSAECDPLAMTQGVVAALKARGVRVLSGHATAYGREGGRAAVELANGRVIAAETVVLATGYALPPCVSAPSHRVVSSWALKTLPQPPDALWPGRALIWEASESYAYLRTAADGGLIIGGEDEEIADANLRDGLLPDKTRRLQGRLAALRPQAHGDVESSWTGFFGETADGLPLIGPVEGLEGFYGAYGYGGNGITFSFLAARLIETMLAGRAPDWARHLRIGRGH